MKQFLWVMFVITVFMGGWCGLVYLNRCGPAWCNWLIFPWAAVALPLAWNAYPWSPEGRRMARKRKEFQAYLNSIKDTWVEE